MLVLQVLHYPEHVKACLRAASPQASEAGVSEELRLAGVLIEAASGEVDWGAYRDTTAQELRALVEAKLQGHKAQEGGRPARAILPLLEALQQSVAAAQTQGERAGRGKRRAARQRRRRTA